MSYLRRISTTRLLALCATVAAVAAGGTAIATALDNGGPPPPRRTLADAVHRALSAPAQQGVQADIVLTNHLIDTSAIHTHNPLLDGAPGRVWVSRVNGLRLELQSDRGDSELVVAHGQFSFYDASSNTVYRGQLPHHRGAQRADPREKAGHVPTVTEIQNAINRLARSVNLSPPIRGRAAHEPAYTVRVSPRHAGGLLGALELGWDANHGLPLRFAVFARGNREPVLELKATNVTYGPVSASDINIAPPADAKVAEVSGAKGAREPRRAGRHGRMRQHDRSPSGLAAVRARLPFPLSAPSTLVGLPRHSVRLISFRATPAALVTYGQGLGAIAVLEREITAADQAGAGSPAHRRAASAGGEEQGSLPTISINGATGHEVPTALGTLLSFDRRVAGHHISYTVAGSIAANAAEAAARAL